MVQFCHNCVPTNIARTQQFFGRRYLRAWADNELMGIGQQRDFYEIREMTLDDIAWPRSLCARMALDVHSYTLPLIGEFNELFAIKRRLLARASGDFAGIEGAVSLAT